MTCLSAGVVEFGDGLRPPQPQSSNSDSSVLIDLYEASEHNGPVLHYYVVVVNSIIAKQNDPNDFDIDEVVVVVTVLVISTGFLP